MDDITRRYMHDVRIMPSMGKAETAANGWISNRPSVVSVFIVCEVLPIFY